MTDSQPEHSQYKANRVFLRRTYDDGRIEEFDLELDGNRIVGDVPAADSSVAGRRWGEEYVVEWAEPTTEGAQP